MLKNVRPVSNTISSCESQLTWILKSATVHIKVNFPILKKNPADAELNLFQGFLMVVGKVPDAGKD